MFEKFVFSLKYIYIISLIVVFSCKISYAQPLSNVFPSNGQQLSLRPIDFSWNVIADAESYLLQVSNDNSFSTICFSDTSVANSILCFDSLSDQVYFWRIIANLPSSQTDTSSIFSFRLFHPLSVNGIKLWVAADTGLNVIGGKVADWYDLSGNDNHLVQADDNYRPMVLDSGINISRAVSFDGINDHLSVLMGQNFSQPNTYFVLWNVTGTAGSIQAPYVGSTATNINITFWRSDYIELNGGVFVPSIYPKSIPFDYIISTTKFEGSNSELYENSILEGLVNGGSHDINTITLGGQLGQGYFLHGNVCEFIFYNSSLSLSNRLLVEKYLMNKYYPPVNLGFDIDVPYGFCDTTLDAGQRFISYTWSTGETSSAISVSQGGVYSVIATNIFGVSSRDTIIVNKPSLNHINDTTGCLSIPVTVSAGLSDFYQFLWSTTDTIDSICISNPDQYWLKVTDSMGCSVTDTFSFAVDSFAVQASLGPDRSACRGELLTLQSGGSQAVSYLWSTGDSTAAISMNALPGTYQDYSVSVTNTSGCMAEDTITVFIRGDVPNVNFSADSVCPGQATQFTDLSSAVPPENPDLWMWDFGDGDTSSLQNPSHVYPAYGVYNANLTVTTDSGCNKSYSQQVIVWADPVVDFMPLLGCSGKSISFNDRSTNPLGSNSDWLWDFDLPGNSDTSSEQNPDFTFSLPGTYDVSLSVTSASGCSHTEWQEVEIRESPDVGFYWSQSCAGQSVYFTDTTTVPVWEEILARKWYFGDGDSSANSNPSHLYSTAGTYNVSLWVRSLNGCTAEITHSVEVYPLPDARIAPGTLCAGTPIQFIDSSSISGDLIVDWDWSFGELGSSNDQNPWFIPTDTGMITVSLFVSSMHGCTDSTSYNFYVSPLPHADFIFEPEFGTAPLDVGFLNISTGSATWLWKFGDATPNSTQQHPLHTFLIEGVYDVVLNAYGPTGCADSISKKVYVMMLKTDVSITGVTAGIDNGMLHIEADILNSGTRRIDALDLSAHYNGSASIVEHCDVSLQPGESYHYIFNASFQVGTAVIVDYACAAAAITGYDPDDDPRNNEDCDVMSESFNLSTPYPNPVSGELNIDIILPFADQLKVSVFNEAGKRVALLWDGPCQKGFTKILLNTEGLSAGAYAVQVLFRDKREEQKFIKY